MVFIINIAILLVFGIIMACATIFLFISFLITVFRGAPFVPSRKRTVKDMISLAKIQPGQKAADLGSGDGRIVIALAKAGAEAHGYELNPFLVLWSRWRIWRVGLEKKAFIHRKNFWHENLSSFNAITLYGISHIMKRLEKKLQEELRPGARIVSNAFSFPNWKPSKKEGSLYLYENK